MQPMTIECKKCGNIYTAYIYEFAVCPLCLAPADGIVYDDSEDDLEDESADL